MSETEFPLTSPYELGRLSQAGDEVDLSASADERTRIARWANVDAVEEFHARIGLRKLSATRFAYEADMSAEIVQSCVVTLEPLRSRIDRKISRELVLTEAEHRGSARRVELDPCAADENGREEIFSLRYDLAIPVLEELALAVDPYPRAPGVQFVPPRDEESPEHPFAALKRLKIEP